jgi:hypothetical protein
MGREGKNFPGEKALLPESAPLKNQKAFDLIKESREIFKNKVSKFQKPFLPGKTPHPAKSRQISLIRTKFSQMHLKIPGLFSFLPPAAFAHPGMR